MTWNFSFCLVTGIMLMVICGYYAAYPRLPVVLNRYFITLVVTEVLTLASDILSTWMDMNHGSFPIWLLYIANMLFFLFFVARSYGLYAYTVTLLCSRSMRRRFSWVGRIFAILFWAIILSSFFTGAVFSIDSNGYHSGPLYMLVVYGELYLFLILGLYLLLLYRKNLGDSFFYGMLLIYTILTIGGICRYLFPGILLMDTFFMISIMILYITIHNADLFRESRTMSFDYQAFEMVMREHHSYGTWYQLIGIMSYNYNESRQIYGGVQIDRALTQISRYLREMFRDGTIFYERSGCFLILIEGKEAAQRAIKEILPDVRRRFRESWSDEDSRVYMNFVFGQMNSDLQIPSVDLELEVIRRLLEKGGNGELNQDFVVDSGMIDSIAREFTVKKALSDALQKNGIQVYMQPIIEAKTGKVVGAEALSRLFDPKLGLIPPSEFIPLAERSGSIIQIGEQVLSKTCQFLNNNREAMSGLSFVNINLSPIQCMDHDLSGTFDMVPKSYGIDPGKLHLEITEESLVEPDILRNQMDLLRMIGYSFALDDFGSGYANQFQIKMFPFTGIKLDMKIVWAHFADPDAILPNAVNTFLDRGLSVTAEGVESEEMARQLTEMGCTYLQGFYYSKPLPMEEFVKYVQREAS